MLNRRDRIYRISSLSNTKRRRGQSFQGGDFLTISQGRILSVTLITRATPACDKDVWVSLVKRAVCWWMLLWVCVMVCGLRSQYCMRFMSCVVEWSDS